MGEPCTNMYDQLIGSTSTAQVLLDSGKRSNWPCLCPCNDGWSVSLLFLREPQKQWATSVGDRWKDLTIHQNNLHWNEVRAVQHEETQVFGTGRVKKQCMWDSLVLFDVHGLWTASTTLQVITNLCQCDQKICGVCWHMDPKTSLHTGYIILQSKSKYSVVAKKIWTESQGQRCQ